MKKIIPFILFVLIIMSFSSCQPQQKEIIYGNTIGNFLNTGGFLSYNGGVFCSEYTDQNEHLLKCIKDCPCEEYPIPLEASELNIIKDDLYFICGSDIQKMNMKTKKITDITEINATISNLFIVNDDIYMLKGSNGNLTKYNIKTKKTVDFNISDIGYYAVYDNYIYYIRNAFSEDRNLYRMSAKDGSDKTLISDKAFLFHIFDDKLYIVHNDSQNIFSYDLDGKNEQLVYSGQVFRLNDWGGKLYISDGKIKQIIALDIASGETEKICDAVPLGLDIAEGILCYCEWIDNPKSPGNPAFVMVDIETKEKTIIYE